MRRSLAFAALAVALATLGAPALGQDADRVRVFVVTLDGLHPDQVGPNTPFLNDLKAQGTWYASHQAVMASETLPNHVAMGTGTWPERNGIPSNVGRARPGDTEEADPDLGIPELREAESLVATIEAQCPDLRTVTAFSKSYVYNTFSTDPADADFDQPTFNIPRSNHALDGNVMGFVLQETNSAPADYLFANLGDIDRAGHIDVAGGLGAPPAGQQVAMSDADNLLRVFVEQLESEGVWEQTVLIFASDHSMDWAFPANPAVFVDVAGVLEDDPRTAGEFLVTAQGGSALVYLLEPDAADADATLAAARDLLANTDGVAEALFRLPFAGEPDASLAEVHPDWRMHDHERTGDIFVHTEQGFQAGAQSDEPVPGFHGHEFTRPATLLITGGWDGVRQGEIATDTFQVDIAPTVGWLLGVDSPEWTDGSDQWQGRVLDEAFDRQPIDVCAASSGGGGGGTTGGTTTGGTTTGGTSGASDMPATGAGLAIAAVLAALAIAPRHRRT